jgi:hypothetical protein
VRLRRKTSANLCKRQRCDKRESENTRCPALLQTNFGSRSRGPAKNFLLEENDVPFPKGYPGRVTLRVFRAEKVKALFVFNSLRRGEGGMDDGANANEAQAAKDTEEGLHTEGKRTRQL